MRARNAPVALLSLVAATALALDDPLPRPNVRLDVEPILVDLKGELHPLAPGSVLDYDFTSAAGGGYMHTIVLSKEPLSSLLVDLTWEMTGSRKLELVLKRKLGAPPKEEPLPEIRKEIDVLDAWTVTMHEDKAHGKFVLRVIPVITELLEDEEFTADVPMWISHAPLIESKPHPQSDVLVFTDFNLRGVGLDMGIPTLGRVKLAPFPLPGATRCGWVRGHAMEFELGGRKFQATSRTAILPEDPSRLGKGWFLYGVLDADPKLDRRQSYYSTLPDDARPRGK